MDQPRTFRPWYALMGHPRLLSAACVRGVGSSCLDRQAGTRPRCKFAGKGRRVETKKTGLETARDDAPVHADSPPPAPRDPACNQFISKVPQRTHEAALHVSHIAVACIRQDFGRHLAALARLAAHAEWDAFIREGGLKLRNNGDNTRMSAGTSA